MLSETFRCIRWDMRGHARSDCPDDESSYSKQCQVDDINAVLSACKVQSAVFLGHSMGGYDHMLYYLSSAENAARVRAFVIFASGPGYTKDKGRISWNANADKLSDGYREKGLEALVGSDRTKGHTTTVGLVHAAKRVMAQREDDPLFVRLKDMGGVFAAATHLHKLCVPALIIIGERDKGFRRAADMMLAKLPQAELVLVANAGHMANEKATTKFNEHVGNFISSLSSHSKL